jgi:hypothetical protein
MDKRKRTYSYNFILIFLNFFESIGLITFCYLVVCIFIVLSSIVVLASNGQFLELCHYSIQ